MEALDAAFVTLLGTQALTALRTRLRFGSEADPLSDWERLAIHVYTTACGYHADINHALINPPPPAPIGIIAGCLAAAIEKLPPYRGYVYRGVTAADVRHALDTTYRVGQIVRWAAFTSTSSQDTAAFTGNLRFVILSRTGRILGAYSSAIEEGEVLFAPGTRFVVRAVDRDGDDAVVELEDLAE